MVTGTGTKNPNLLSLSDPRGSGGTRKEGRKRAPDRDITVSPEEVGGLKKRVRTARRALYVFIPLLILSCDSKM